MMTWTAAGEDKPVVDLQPETVHVVHTLDGDDGPRFDGVRLAARRLVLT